MFKNVSPRNFVKSWAEKNDIDLSDLKGYDDDAVGDYLVSTTWETLWLDYLDVMASFPKIEKRYMKVAFNEARYGKMDFEFVRDFLKKDKPCILPK